MTTTFAPIHTPEHAAVRHLLESETIIDRTAPYIRADGFDWDGLLREAESFSGGEALLVRIAYDLCESRGVVGVWELPRHLGPASFERVLEALAICRGQGAWAAHAALAA